MTEQEKFEDVIKQAGKSQFLVKNENGEYLNLAVAAMFEVFKSRQPEIDALRKELHETQMMLEKEANAHAKAKAILKTTSSEAEEELRKELEQVKMHKEMLLEAAINADVTLSDYEYSDHFSRKGISNAITATSEQIESYRAEIIAQAKEEQREMDAVAGKEWAMELCEESWKPESIFNAIRNNKE